LSRIKEMNGNMDKTDGIINNDGGERAIYFGMWRESWTVDSYMWKTGNIVYMSHMKPTKISGKARFAVIEHLNRLGYDVIIPNPDFLMWPEDPRHWGFIPSTVKTYMGEIVVWNKLAKK
jgi:hypothetical protein